MRLGVVTGWFLCSFLAFTTASTMVRAEAPPSFGSGGLKSQGIPGSINQDGSLNAAVVVTNTSKTAARLFISQYPTASDNRGHSWFANINNNTVSGIHICGFDNRCLTDVLKATEQSATMLDPGQQMTINIKLTISQSIKPGEQYGDLYNIGILAGAQPVREEQTATGSAIIGGAWRTYPLGVASVPLRKPD